LDLNLPPHILGRPSTFLRPGASSVVPVDSVTALQQACDRKLLPKIKADALSSSSEFDIVCQILGYSRHSVSWVMDGLQHLIGGKLVGTMASSDGATTTYM
jgi:hypothetical protein